MKLKKLIYLIIFLITPIQAVLTQDLDSRLHQLIEKNKIDIVRGKLESVKKKYPDLPTPYYVEAFLETDGKKAFTKYKDFVKRFPQSKYVSNAQYKMAQFYYARGLYRSAKKILSSIISNYPNSPCIDDANYLMICCLVALDITDDAGNEIRNFIKNYPRSTFKNVAEQDLRKIKKARSNKRIKQNYKSIDNLNQNYTIQVGAFSNRQNATKQMETISDCGYTAEIIPKTVNNILFFLVWVGDFETQEQALNFGEIFKKKYGMTFRVVKNDR